MVAPVPTARKQFTALWLKQWRLTRRAYITCACNILFPIIIMAALLGLERFLDSQISIKRPAVQYPTISPPWYLYESEAKNDSVFIPPATFLYATSAGVNDTDVGSFDPLSTGILAAAYAPQAWVKFVEFDTFAGTIQPKEILNPDFNFSFVAEKIASESDIVSTLYTGFKGARPPSYVSAYSIKEVDLVNRRFAFDVFVNGSLSRYADLASATALIDHGISLLLNATAPGVMRFLGYKNFPFLGGKFNEVDITDSAPFFFLILLSMLFAVFVNLIVYEKEKRLLVLMKMNGLRMSMWWLVNYVFCFALYFVVMVFFLGAGGVLRFRFMTQNSPGVLVILFLLWGFALVSFAFAFATLFSRSRTAIVSSYFWIILTALVANFLIENWVRDIDGKQALANIVSLVPPWCLYRAMVYIAMQTENRGPGVSFSEVADSKMNIAACYGYLIFHAVFWLLLALYLGEVLPSEYGIRRRPLFFLSKSYWLGTGDAAHRLPAYERVAGEPATVAKEREVTFGSNDFAVRVLGLRKEYPNGKVAVANVALSIDHGVCLGLLGSNGAGKTTLISMLCGLIPPSSGDATVDGLSIRADMTEIHRRIGVCPQMDVLWDDLTGRETLSFFARLKGLTGKELDDAVRTGLEGVRLRPARHKLTKKYSGGMKRRLSVAISLVGDPKVVFLDEPSTGLDPASRQTLWECIRTSKAGKAMVLTTHSMEEAEALCDRHAVFCDGSLRAVGLASELKAMYSPSLRLAVNLRRDTAAKRADALDRFITETFPTARSDSSKAIAEFRTYMLPSTSRLSEIFRRIDGARDSLGIADWAVSNATLEEVFFAVVRIARLVDVRKANGTWRPEEVALALAQYSSAPRVPATRQCSDEVWALALVAAYFTAQPEVEQSEWRDFSLSLNETLRTSNVEPALIGEARTALQNAQLLFQA